MQCCVRCVGYVWGCIHRFCAAGGHRSCSRHEVGHIAGPSVQRNGRGGLERVRSISIAPKTDVTSTSPPVSHNFAPSLPMTSLENAPLPRPGSLALGLTPALCSPCRPRSTLLVREFVTVTVTAGSIKIAKAHPGLAFSPRVQCNQLCFERGRPLQAGLLRDRCAESGQSHPSLPDGLPQLRRRPLTPPPATIFDSAEVSAQR